MPFHVIQPPADESKLATAGQEIFLAAQKLGLNLDVEGFLHAWLTGLRVLVERKDGEIVGLCLMALGKRWTSQDFTASVLELRGDDHDGLLEFAKQIAAAMGADSLFHQTTEPFPREVDRKIIHTVTQYLLQ